MALGPIQLATCYVNEVFTGAQPGGLCGCYPWCTNAVVAWVSGCRRDSGARRASGFHWLALCRERLLDSSTAPLRLLKSLEARKK